jgi:hypothetical protein
MLLEFYLGILLPQAFAILFSSKANFGYVWLPVFLFKALEFALKADYFRFSRTYAAASDSKPCVKLQELASVQSLLQAFSELFSLFVLSFPFFSVKPFSHSDVRSFLAHELEQKFKGFELFSA